MIFDYVRYRNGRLAMSDEAAVVFTAKSVERILRDVGYILLALRPQSRALVCFRGMYPQRQRGMG